MNLFRLQKNILNVPMGGIEPPSEGYESSALTIELHRQKNRNKEKVLRDQDLHLGLEVMGLARYYFSIPLFSIL